MPPLTASLAEYRQVTDRLATASGSIACDVERAQGFVYTARAYLIQLARVGAGIVLVDPIGEGADQGMDALAAAINDNEFILHAADQDLANLREVGIEPGSLFDTEVAALLVGRPHVGLAALTEELLGVRLAKEHQTSNWSQRPLPEDWRAYAALDVDYLFELKSALAVLLEKAGRTEWAAQEFDHILHAPAKQPKADPWRIKGAGRLATRRQLAALKELWTARDALGREFDIEPAKFLSTRALVPLAQALPRSVKQAMKDIPELRYRRARQHADVWQAALDRARALDDVDLPVLRRPLLPGELPPVKDWRHLNPPARRRLAAIKKVVTTHADELGIRPDLVVPPAVQRQLAWNGWPSDVEAAMADLGARPWQIALTGADLAALSQD
ncbi:MAG: HRDC domain-containing protein [Actinomycetaceae bacterium]|nr:HRDC domain-containing protein [Actinomycetaceae bacterium]MDU0969423.1 HRDC domain-containing protein [Actinomycetaceae bacterium]